MVYLYAVMGIAMMSGIMAILEMGLSLTGQSMMPTPPDQYFSDPAIKASEVKLLGDLADPAFSVLVLSNGLCGALDVVDPDPIGMGWNLIGQGRWANSCQLNRGRHRIIVRQDLQSNQMPYRLYSCLLLDQEKCFFESE